MPRTFILLAGLMLSPLMRAQDTPRLVPAKQPVNITLLAEVSSQTARNGEIVHFVLADDLRVGDVVVAPKGSPVHAEIVHAQKAGIGGKSGELLMSVRYIDLGTQRIALRSLRPYVGDNKSTEAMTMAMIPVVGLFSPFMKGGDIVLPAGTHATALVAKDTPIPDAASPVAATPIPTTPESKP